MAWVISSIFYSDMVAENSSEYINLGSVVVCNNINIKYLINN